MTCPKCGMKRALQDRVCRRCKYLFDEDRFISTDPPRRGDELAPSDPRVSEGKERIQGRINKMAYVAALIPGLGHFLRGDRRRAAIFFLLVTGLLTVSVFTFAGGFGQLLFGLGVSAHAYSIFDLTPWRQAPSAVARGVAMGVILLGLLMLYWPAVRTLALVMVAPEVAARGRLFGGVQDLTPGWIVFFGAVFLGTMWLSVWMSRRLSSGDDRMGG